MMLPSKAATANKKTKTPTEPDTNSNWGVDLAAIVAEADDALSTKEEKAAAAIEAQGPDYHGEASMMVDMLAGLIVGYAPDTAPIWTEDKKKPIVAALVPVMEKYGITGDTLPCELVLILVAGPALYSTAKIVFKQMQADKAAAVPDVADIAPAARKQEAADTPMQPRHPQEMLYK